MITRERALAAMQEDRFDVVVVGGGITGAGVALDAASRGYSVALVGSVREASIKGEDDCPDLVFLDLGDSPQKGLAMLRELKADECLGAIPLVMLASFDSLDDIRAGLGEGHLWKVVEVAPWSRVPEGRDLLVPFDG